MEIIIPQKEFAELLAKAQNIAEKKSSMPALINVLLEAEGDLLRIYATDLEVSLTDQVEVEMKQPGKIGVNAKNLYELIKELRAEPVHLLAKENHWLEIQQGKSEFHIVGISAEEYPVFPTYATKDFVTVSPNTLREMIEKTMYSVSNDESKYHLNGVYFEKKSNGTSGNYRMVATDGYRLSLIDRDLGKESFDFSQGVIIPRKGLMEIRKMIEAQSSDHIDVAVEGAQLIVKSGSTVLMIRLVEGRYPNYQQLIPNSLGGKVLLKREDFLTSLKRVSLLSNQKSKGVTLTLSQGKMEITSNNPEMGDAREEIDVEYKGHKIAIAFNARYIIDILNSFDDDNVDFEVRDEISPGLIRPHNDKGHTCVIMPMRI